jgi:RNA polymerase sigma factor (sigma-70 family)
MSVLSRPGTHRMSNLRLRARGRARDFARTQARRLIAPPIEENDVPVDQEVTAAVEAVLKKLSKRQRKIIFGRYWENKCHHDIARELGSNSGAVRRMLSSALKQLRRVLRGRSQLLQLR